MGQEMGQGDFEQNWEKKQDQNSIKAYNLEDHFNSAQGGPLPEAGPDHCKILVNLSGLFYNIMP